jgi:hypothetical protein
MHFLCKRVCMPLAGTRVKLSEYRFSGYLQLGGRFNHAVLFGPSNCSKSITHVELAIEARHVILDGRFGEEEFFSDLGVRVFD